MALMTIINVHDDAGDEQKVESGDPFHLLAEGKFPNVYSLNLGEKGVKRQTKKLLLCSVLFATVQSFTPIVAKVL